MSEFNGALIISIIRGDNLAAADSNGKSDPYVVVTVKNASDEKLETYTTKIQKATLNPYWNEKFSVVTKKPTTGFTLKFSVFDHDTFTSDRLGQADYTITTNTQLNVEQILPLKQVEKKDVVSGTITIHLNYQRKTAETEKKRNILEIGSDAKDMWKNLRLANPEALTDEQVEQMERLISIYRREIMWELPDAYVLLDKDTNLFIKVIKFKVPKIKVTPLDWEVKKWLNLMASQDGPFKLQAESIIKIVCEYQVIRAARKWGDGYGNDPEGLFMEELKDWACKQLSNFETSQNTQDILEKRIRYFEEVLCENNLFDRPGSRLKHTIQQVIVSSRGVLKYNAIPILERELSNHDARRSFDSLKRHLVSLISDSTEVLTHVFFQPAPEPERVTKATDLLRRILDSDTIKKAFPDAQREIRAKVFGEDKTTSPIQSPPWIRLGAQGKLYLAEDLVTYGAKKDLVEMTDDRLFKVFTGPESGLEERFRGNAFVAKHYLEVHALILEIGSLYGVIDKAAECASQGGTLLVYGMANAHLNAMLETTDDLLGALRESLNMVVRIAEVRFEELVYANEATPERNPWVGHFKRVHSTLAKGMKMLVTILKELADIKAQANSMTLYQMFQKAKDDTATFLTMADDFSKHMSEVLGVPYEKPEPKHAVALPEMEALVAMATGAEEPHPPVSNEPLKPLHLDVGQAFGIK